MTIDPNSIYRIQNSDYATYLELPSATDNEQVGLRVLKQSNKQQWKFIPATTVYNVYKIKNAQDSYLGLKSSSKNPILVGVQAESSAIEWTVTVSDGLWKLKTTIKGTTKYLELGTYDLRFASASSNYDDQKWNLLPAQPSFVGSRRIRSFNGGSLLTLSNGTDTTGVYGSPPDAKNKNQIWSVLPTGNVHFYLKVGDQYLARDDNDVIQGSATAFPWEIKFIHGFAYSIFDTKKQLPLGLPDSTTNSKVSLLPVNNVHGKFWFFEPEVANATTDGTDSGPGDQDNTPEDDNGDNGPGTSGTPVAWTIAEAQYYLKNVGTGNYLSTSSVTDFESTLDTSDSSLRYEITFNSSTKTMKIKSHAADYPVVPDSKSQVVVVKSNNTGGNVWALVREKKDSTNYFICIYSGGVVTRKIIGSALSSDPEGVVIEDLKVGENNHLWQFIRIY